MSHVVLSLQTIVLFSPSCNLQSADSEQVAVELAPAFTSHLVDEAQVTVAVSSVAPLHSELSAH
jgi:hypothetical protein